MVKTILIYWRDIPSQVIVQRGRHRVKRALSQRFQKAIDRAAMRAGKGSSDAYLSEWRRETSIVEGHTDIAALLEQEAAKLEANFSDDLLDKMIRGKGISES